MARRKFPSDQELADRAAARHEYVRKMVVAKLLMLSQKRARLARDEAILRNVKGFPTLAPQTEMRTELVMPLNAGSRFFIFPSPLSGQSIEIIRWLNPAAD